MDSQNHRSLLDHLSRGHWVRETVPAKDDVVGRVKPSEARGKFQSPVTCDPAVVSCLSLNTGFDPTESSSATLFCLEQTLLLSTAKRRAGCEPQIAHRDCGICRPFCVNGTSFRRTMCIRSTTLQYAAPLAAPVITRRVPQQRSFSTPLILGPCNTWNGTWVIVS